jgi:hypothetical protein
MNPEPEYINDKGRDRLWQWFGLSRAAWITLPRVMAHDMPDEWQDKMAALLEEWDATWTNQPDVGTRVMSTDHRNKVCKVPEWMLNYRHPDRDKLNLMREPF